MSFHSVSLGSRHSFLCVAPVTLARNGYSGPRFSPSGLQRCVILSDLFVLQEVFQTVQASKPADATGFESSFLELHLEVGPAIH